MISTLHIPTPVLPDVENQEAQYHYEHRRSSSISYQDNRDSLQEVHHISHYHKNGIVAGPKISLRSLPSQSKLKLQQPFNQAIPRIDIKIIALCVVWYLTSILSNNSTKAILRQFKYPVTLTELQFILTQFFCVITLALIKLDTSHFFTSNFPNGTFPAHTSVRQLVTPTRLILTTTIPMGAFQFIGHITSHKATSVIPVSLVHTVKALSPITTVLIYRVLFKRQFDRKTYLTLIPLVIGVMLSCLKPNNKSPDNSSPWSYETGCFFAFCSMLIFVSQNIFAKKILTASTTKKSLLPHAESQQDQTLDKLTILYWCSTVGFVMTLPVYFFSEYTSSSATWSIGEIDTQIWHLLLLNGFAHFVQSLMAFQILGIISTVNYSIVNILKRICVILASIAYERQSVSSVQGFGLCLTFIGLYAYDKWGKSRV